MIADRNLSSHFAAALDGMARAAAGDARKLAALAAAAFNHQLNEQAYALAKDARALAPDDPEVGSLTQRAITAGIPEWHFPMLRDRPRNEAFEAALKRAIRPGMRVLDIGAGTGLLAMMAARAGAETVVSCEASRAIADVAREIVALNGFGERVRVLAKHSTALDPEEDLGGPVDLVVSEIISNNLLSEYVLPAAEDAAARLLKPGGRMIPAGGAVRVALAWWEGLSERWIGEVCGFDVSPINRLDPQPHRVRRETRQLRLASADADLFAFDFTRADPAPPAETALELVAEQRANGIAQWIRIDLDEGIAYENRPGPGPTSSWACLFHPFAARGGAEAGAAVRVHGAHNRTGLRIWAELLPNDAAATART